MDSRRSSPADSAPDRPWRWFEALFAAALDAVLVADDQGRCIDANPAAQTLLGYSLDELRQLRVQDLTALDPTRPFAEQWERFLSSGRSSGEFEVRCKDGTGRTVALRAVANVVPERHVWTLRDITEITERKRVEAQLRTSGEQLRRISARIEHAIEHERTELARELHDQLGQALTALKMDLAWLTQQIDQLPPEARATLSDKTTAMSTAIDTIIREVRRISAGLRPIALDRLGLLEAIEWQADEFERRTGIRCRFDSKVSAVDLASDQATQIFRIVQEALTNTTRHAQATRVTIVAGLLRSRFVLEVRDNGRGISTEALADPSALGLAGMRERALLAGGELTIARVGRKGTVVRITVAVPAKGTHT